LHFTGILHASNLLHVSKATFLQITFTTGC
jgi:hypothetical protein